jgi:hypothetical protein
MHAHQDVDTQPARLDEADLKEALLRMWAAGLAHGADRPDFRKLASALLVVLDEAEHLRRAGRSAMVPVKVRDTLLSALQAKPIRGWTLTTLREKLIKIGAKVVAHAKYLTFQLAEVAVPRQLFGALLERIGRLRLAKASVTEKSGPKALAVLPRRAARAAFRGLSEGMASCPPGAGGDGSATGGDYLGKTVETVLSRAYDLPLSRGRGPRRRSSGKDRVNEVGGVLLGAAVVADEKLPGRVLLHGARFQDTCANRLARSKTER